jgi:hypothetical protein
LDLPCYLCFQPDGAVTVFRNAGGRAAPAYSTLVALDALLQLPHLTNIPLGSLEGSIREDVEFLRHSLLLKHVNVTGWLLETETGIVAEIVERAEVSRM